MRRRFGFRRERGASLVLGVMLLALLSLMVTAAFSDNRWQLRISTNQIVEQRAQRAARSALGWAEFWLMSRPGGARLASCSAACAPGTPVMGSGTMPDDLEARDEAWWLAHGVADGFDPETGVRLAERDFPDTPSARWLVEEAHFEPATAEGRPATSYYRIVARAARAPAGEPVFLELLLARPWGDESWTDPLPPVAVPFCRLGDAPSPCGRMAWRRRQ